MIVIINFNYDFIERKIYVKLKKSLALLLILGSTLMLVSFGASSVGDNMVSNVSEKQEDTINNELYYNSYEYKTRNLGEYDFMLSPNVSYEELITKEFDLEAFIAKYYPNPCLSMLKEPLKIEQIKDEYVIECFRKNEAKNYYSVHKAKQGGIVYIFYKYYLEDENKKLSVYNWLYVREKLSESDFESIKVGSTLDDVIVVDQATEAIKNRMLGIQEVHKPFVTHSMHYLEDGIMTIFYKYSDGKFYVVDKVVGGTSVEKRDRFHFDIYYPEYIAPYNAEVLDIDYFK